MKFITKGLYYSMQFYSYFLHSSKQEILNKRIRTQKEYRLFIKNKLNQDVYDYKKVLSVLFDQNQKIHELDQEKYDKIIEIANRYLLFQDEQFMLVSDLKQKIIQGNYSGNIKFLANIHYHDCAIVDISYEYNMLSIEFDDFYWRRNTKYLFDIKEFLCNVPIEELKSFNVLYEELIVNPDNCTFEYNILISNYGDNVSGEQIKEISIIFTDIKSIEHAY